VPAATAGHGYRVERVWADLMGTAVDVERSSRQASWRESVAVRRGRWRPGNVVGRAGNGAGRAALLVVAGDICPDRTCPDHGRVHRWMGCRMPVRADRRDCASVVHAVTHRPGAVRRRRGRSRGGTSSTIAAAVGPTRSMLSMNRTISRCAPPILGAVACPSAGILIRARMSYRAAAVKAVAAMRYCRGSRMGERSQGRDKRTQKPMLRVRIPGIHDKLPARQTAAGPPFELGRTCFGIL